MIFEQRKEFQVMELVSGISVKMRKLAESSLKSIGLTYPQFGTLFVLQQWPDITQKQLATKLETDTNTAMVILNSLEKKKFIRRVPDPNDKRINRLQITKAGAEVLCQAAPLMENVYKPVLMSFAKNDLNVLLPALERAYQVVRSLESI